MASFCTSCGAPVTGPFCTGCGKAVHEGIATGQNAVSPAPPAVAKSSGSGVKILFIVLGILLALGAVGVGSVVYLGYRAQQKIAELKKQYGIESEGATDGANGAASSTRVFPPSQGNGCKLLEGQEAAGILGVAVDRVESDPNGSNGSLSCRYWVSAAERQRLMKQEIASGLAGMGKSDAKDSQLDVEKLIGGAAGALAEANGDVKNSDYAFSLQVWQKNGKDQWEKMELAQTKTKDAMGADVAAVAMQSVEGIGDRAIELAAGHSIMVLKGDAFFLLGFQQFVPGREKTAALARVVAGRI